MVEEVRGGTPDPAGTGGFGVLRVSLVVSVSGNTSHRRSPHLTRPSLFTGGVPCLTSIKFSRTTSP